MLYKFYKIFLHTHILCDMYIYLYFNEYTFESNFNILSENII